MRLAIHRPKTGEDESIVLPPVSILICARNEAANLSKNLPLILEQDYPEFEVVVINDRSEDGTQDLLIDLQSRYPKLRVSHIGKIGENLQGKKFALTMAVKAAKHKYLLLTDADCAPAGPHWVREMCRQFTETSTMILGYGSFNRAKGLLNTWIRYETFFTAVQYFSFALAGMPYMGVGRNLAYKRNMFFDAGGFKKHRKLASGDDDLFVNAVATRKNTAVCLNRDAFTYSDSKRSWASWYRQKRRHLSTGKFYRPGILVILAIFSLSHILFYVTLIILLVFLYKWQWLLVAYLIRLLIQAMMFLGINRHLQEKSLLIFTPLFDFLYTLFYIIFAPAALFRKSTKWE